MCNISLNLSLALRKNEALFNLTSISNISLPKIILSLVLFHIFPKLSIIYLVFYISGFIYPISSKLVI